MSGGPLSMRIAALGRLGIATVDTMEKKKKREEIKTQNINRFSPVMSLMKCGVGVSTLWCNNKVLGFVSVLTCHIKGRRAT